MNNTGISDDSRIQLLKEIYQLIVNDESNDEECPWTKGKGFYIISFTISLIILLYFVLFNATSIKELFRIRLRPLVPWDFITERKYRISQALAFFISASYIMELIYSELFEWTCPDIPSIVKIISMGVICYPFFAVDSSQTIFGHVVGILYGLTILCCGIYFELIDSSCHEFPWSFPAYLKYFFIVLFILYSIFCIIRLLCNEITPREAAIRSEKAVMRNYVKHVLHIRKSRGDRRVEPEVLPTYRFGYSIYIAVVLLIWVCVIIFLLMVRLRKLVPLVFQDYANLNAYFTYKSLEFYEDLYSCILTFDWKNESSACAVTDCIMKVMNDHQRTQTMILIMVIGYLIYLTTTCMIIVTCFAFAVTCVNIHLMNRNFMRTLRLAYKGQYPEIRRPSTISGSRALTNFACFTGYNVGYLLMSFFAFVVFFFLLSAICIIVGFLFYYGHGNHLLELIPWWWLFLFFVLILSRFLLIRFLFVHDNMCISIKNRKAFLFWSYFTYFTDIPLGWFSFYIRLILNNILVIFFCGRIDVPTIPKCFENYDNGFNVYSGFVLTEVTLNHPILRAFVDLCLETQTSWMNKLYEVGDQESFQALRLSEELDVQPKMSKERLIRKWQLMYTLIRNPSLVKDRKHNVRSQRLKIVS